MPAAALAAAFLCLAAVRSCGGEPGNDLRPQPDPVTDANAARILALSGIGRGLCLDVGSGDGRLAAALARRSELWIQCCEPDAKLVIEARRNLDAAGLYGLRAAVDEVDFSSLPLPDNCARLVICGDGLAGGRGKLDFKEILRVLHPYGVAVIGRGAATGSGRKLGRAELELWLKDAGFASVEIVEKDGLWAVARKARPKGWDEWPQKNHDAANTFGSTDEIAGEPLRLQWYQDCPPALPSSSVVIAGGRQFVAGPDLGTKMTIYGAGRPDLGRISPSLHAYDAFSGALLWKRVGREELPVERSMLDYGPEKSCADVAATDDALYLLGGKVCAVFDAETGGLRGQWPIPAEAGAADSDIWLYLALADGALFGVSGPSPKSKPGWYTMSERGMGRAVFALDAKTGKERWARKLSARANTPCVAGGRVFLFDADFKLRALDAATGKDLWTAEPVKFPSKTAFTLTAKCRGRLWVLYAPGGQTANYEAFKSRRVAVISAEDGKLVAEPEFAKPVSCLTFSGGVAYASGQHNDSPQVAMDAETGKELWSKRFKLGGCTPLVATPKMIFARLSDGPGMVRIDSGAATALRNLRPTCFHPPIPAYGMAHVIAPGCRCPHMFRGDLAMAPGKPSAAEPAPERLVKGAAPGGTAPAADGPVWASWRADAARSATVEEKPAGELKQLWSRSFPGECTPPAVAGGLVFFGSSDRQLRALDAATGEPRWSAFAEGRIGRAPFAASGRIYFADDGGWAHSLAAASGEPLWRFRAAPAADRVIVGGQVASRWPAGCGVLVEGGAAYVTAGLLPDEGVTFYELDAATGAPRWERTFTGSLAAWGNLAFGEKTLYVPSAWGPPRAVRPADPKHDAVSPEGKWWGLDQPKGPDLLPVAGGVLVSTPRMAFTHDVAGLHAYAGSLPVVTDSMIYLRNGRALTAEKREPFALSLGRLAVPKPKDARKAPPPPPPVWTAWKGEEMNAIVLAGDTLFSGGDGKVFATAAADGKELWSLPVPAPVRDLAFCGGRLYALCGSGTIVCFGP